MTLQDVRQQCGSLKWSYSASVSGYRVPLLVLGDIAVSIGSGLLFVRIDTTLDVVAYPAFLGAVLLLLPYRHPWRYITPLLPFLAIMAIGSIGAVRRSSWDELWAFDLLIWAVVQIVLLAAVTTLMRERSAPA